MTAVHLQAPRHMLTRSYRIAQRTIRLLPSWLVRIRPFVVYEIHLRDSEATPFLRPASLPCSVRWVSVDTEASALEPLATVDTIRRWDGRSCRAAGVWLDERIIGCAWIAYQTFSEEEIGLDVVLSQSEAWLFAAHVGSEWRHQGVYGLLLQFLIAELKTGGLERLLFGVTLGNEISRRAHVRHGAVPVGSIMAIKSLGIRCCLRTGRIRRDSQPFAWRRPIRLAVESR